MKRTKVLFPAVVAMALLLFFFFCAPPLTAETPPFPGQEGNRKEDDKGEGEYTKGTDLLFQGKYAEAVEALSRAVEENPESSLFRTSLARAYFLWGKLDKAEDLLKGVVDSTPIKRMAPFF